MAAALVIGLAMCDRDAGHRAIPPAQVTQDRFERPIAGLSHKVNDDDCLGARSALTCRVELCARPVCRPEFCAARSARRRYTGARRLQGRAPRGRCRPAGMTRIFPGVSRLGLHGPEHLGRSGLRSPMEPGEA